MTFPRQPRIPTCAVSVPDVRNCASVRPNATSADAYSPCDGTSDVTRTQPESFDVLCSEPVRVSAGLLGCESVHASKFINALESHPGAHHEITSQNQLTSNDGGVCFWCAKKPAFCHCHAEDDRRHS